MLRGGAGDDDCRGESGNDVLLGEDGNDYLDGGEGADDCSGGLGNDHHIGGKGRDRLHDDRGIDKFETDQDGERCRDRNDDQDCHDDEHEQEEHDDQGNCNPPPPVDPKPIAKAGGPYSVMEGQTIVLNGAASSDNDADNLLTFAWDIGNDGTFDLTGVSPTFDATLIDGAGQSIAVQMRVTDTKGQTSFATTTITVMNANPTAEAGGPYAVNELGSVTLSGSGTDVPGDLPLTFQWDLDGDGQYDDATGASPLFVAPAVTGLQSITVGLRVSDDDGGVAFDTATIAVQSIGPTALANGPYTVLEKEAAFC